MSSCLAYHTQMTTCTSNKRFLDDLTSSRMGRRNRWIRLLCAVATVAFVILLQGCQAPENNDVSQLAQKQPEPQTIREGDVLKIDFPGVPSMDTTQQVRRDGRITLGIIGEVLVIGMTPSDLEKDLLRRYDTQLVSKEIIVTVVSSTFPVFVTGEVLHPGKIQPDHPITALEAIMEAGGFVSEKADMEDVVIIRQEKGGTKNYSLNLKKVLEGKSSESFYLRAFRYYIRKGKILLVLRPETRIPRGHRP